MPVFNVQSKKLTDTQLSLPHGEKLRRNNDMEIKQTDGDNTSEKRSKSEKAVQG